MYKNLIKLPTPLEYYGEVLSNNIYIKRDDFTDVALGGNKARKLKYFVEDAIINEANCLVTYGASQSNHCRITAAFASYHKMKCVLILAGEEEKSFNGNFFISKSLLDAEIKWTSTESVSETITSVMQEMINRGYRPYFIQGGGHGNLGTHAYKQAYDELKNQIPKMDYIFHASGTGTTQAGLILGAYLSQTNVKVVGISVARKEKRCKEVILDSITEYANSNALTLKKINNFILVDDSYVGEGYGDIYPEILFTIKRVAKETTILLDPIYTGKAFYGMVEYIKKNNIKNKDIVFIHTGGTPLLFNYSQKFKELIE